MKYVLRFLLGLYMLLALIVLTIPYTIHERKVWDSTWSQALHKVLSDWWESTKICMTAYID